MIRRVFSGASARRTSYSIRTVDIGLPTWYAPERLDDAAFWTSGCRSNIATLFTRFSLHDCQWLGLTIDPRYDGEAYAAFELDTFWYRQQLPSLAEAGWGAMLLRFDRIRGVRIVGGTLNGAPRTISVEETSSAEGWATTVFHDIYGGRLEVEHLDPVTFLFMSWEGEAVRPLEAAR